MEGIIKKIQNIIGAALDNILITKVNQLKFYHFNKSFRIYGKGMIKSISFVAPNDSTPSIVITVDGKYKTSFYVGQSGLQQSIIGYSIVATINEPIVFNTQLEIDSQSNDLKGSIFYMIEE